MNKKILLIDTAQPLFIEGILTLGYDYKDASMWDLNWILEEVNQYDGIVLRSRISLDKAFFEKATNLKFIAREGAGIEHIDVEEAKKRNIKVLTANEGNRDAVGEHAIGMLLCLMNNINKADQEVRNGIWNRESNRGIELQGKNVGIIGYGNMGNAFACKLMGFDCNVYVYDKYKRLYSRKYIWNSTMKDLFKNTDILSLHIPLTEETNHLVNDRFINKFEKNIIIINTSRGKIVNTKDLVKNIKTGKVIGACLDVLEYENQSFNAIESIEDKESYEYLMGSDKVILTPHIAGWTHESKQKIAKVLVEKIAALNL
jgi:D-3-phosphoglycerate dehydrogenase